MIHIYPVDDIFPHNLESQYCDCNPIVNIKHNMVIHFSFDGRELIEGVECQPTTEEELNKKQ